MIGIILAMALVFVLWIGFQCSIGWFPFLEEYLIYVNWAAGIIGAMLFIALTVIVFRKIFERN